MRLLFVTTRAPWPAHDGGRVLMGRTIDGLAARGHRITVIAPVVASDAEMPGRPAGVEFVSVETRAAGRSRALLDSVWRQEPFTMSRHRSAAVGRVVAAHVSRGDVDLVHVEQLQAMPQAAPALEAGLPVVLRAQNVESDLWRMLARARPAWRPLATLEARRLARAEAAAVARASLTVAVTTADAERFRQLAGPAARVDVVKVPMPAALPAASRFLEGDPALVMLSGRWLPNRDGAEWFLNERWPSIARALPTACLHVFGQGLPAGGPRVHWHPAPESSEDVFVRGTVHLVPLRIASGARVRILEAWSRGIPVVATPEAARGLDAGDGEGLRLASTVDQFVTGLSTLAGDPTAAAGLVAAGQRQLETWHDPARLAEQLEGLYEETFRRIRTD